MLGGKDGVLFSRYAQGLTLRALLKAANPFLAHMTGERYSLLWSPAQAADNANDAGDGKHKRKRTMLLPMIVDHDQHETVRPVSNVSGGERFEVSLSLALGLSRLTAGRVKVDTMFLDEGFGTLDPERLGAALDVLCSIHRDGTTIGVISHVKAVEERLPLTIRVEAAGHGHGCLRGEGAIENAVRRNG
jgi:exonuclease SbcC